MKDHVTLSPDHMEAYYQGERFSVSRLDNGAYLIDDAKVQKLFRKQQGRKWRTPKWVYEPIIKTLGLETDLAAEARTALCPRFFTEEDDALAQTWHGRCWLNPPYDLVLPWVERAIASRCLVAMLVPCAPGVSWFHLAREHAALHTIFQRRIRFDPPIGVAPSSPAGGNSLFLFDGSPKQSKRLLTNSFRDVRSSIDLEGFCRYYLEARVTSAR